MPFEDTNKVRGQMETQHELSQKEAEDMLGRIFAVAIILTKPSKRRQRYVKITRKHAKTNALYRRNIERREQNQRLRQKSAN